MRFFCSAAMGLLLAGSLPVSAEDCVVCDAEVVLAPELVDCFLKQAASALAEMQSKHLPFQMVNLATCAGIIATHRGADGTADSSRQIETWLDVPAEATKEPTITFIVDRASLICLDGLVRKNLTIKNASWAFRPAEMCGR